MYRGSKHQSSGLALSTYSLLCVNKVPLDCRLDIPTPGIWLLCSPQLSRHSDSISACISGDSPCTDCWATEQHKQFIQCAFRWHECHFSLLEDKEDRWTITFISITQLRTRNTIFVRSVIYRCLFLDLYKWVIIECLCSFMISLCSRPESLAGDTAWPSAHPFDSHLWQGR